MNAEELIIGHYERTLDAGQESKLAEMLESSPETRALYEQYGGMEGMMQTEAETIAPSKNLDRDVLLAALAAVSGAATTGVGGILAALATKTGIVATVIVAGGIVATVIGSGWLRSDNGSSTPPAVERSAPSHALTPNPSSPDSKEFNFTPPASNAVESGADAVEQPVQQGATQQQPVQQNRGQAAASTPPAHSTESSAQRNPLDLGSHPPTTVGDSGGVQMKPPASDKSP